MHKKLPERIIGASGPFNYRYAENTTTRSAFWACWIESTGSKYYFCYKFGRIGSNGRSSSLSFSGNLAATTYAADMASDKAGRGYKFVYSNDGAEPFGSTPLAPIVSKPAHPPDVPAPTVPRAVRIPAIVAEPTVDDMLDMLSEL